MAPYVVILGAFWLLLVASLNSADLSHSCFMILVGSYIVFFCLGRNLYYRTLLFVSFALLAVTSAASLVWFALHYSTWLHYGFHEPWRFRRQLSPYSWTLLIGTPDSIIITLVPLGVLFAQDGPRRLLAAFPVYLILCGALFLCLISLSRATYLALLIQSICFFGLVSRGRSRLTLDRWVITALTITGFAAMLAVAVLGYLPSMMGVAGMFVHHEQLLSATGHFSRIVDSLLLIKQHPFAGVGLGGYARALFQASHGRTLANQALNSYVELTCETGIIYILIQGFAVVTVCFGALRGWRSEGRSSDVVLDRYRAACLSSLIGTGVLNCAWSATLHSPLDYLACAAIIGQLNAYSYTIKHQKRSRPQTLDRSFLRLGAVLALVLAIWKWAPERWTASIARLSGRQYLAARFSLLQRESDPTDYNMSAPAFSQSSQEQLTSLRSLSQQLRSYPQDDAAAFLLAELKRSTGDLYGSLTQYAVATSLAPQDWLYRLRYAAALTALNQKGDATQQLASAFYIKPTLVRIFAVDGSWLNSTEGRNTLSLALQVAKSQQALDATGRIASLLYWSGNYSLARPYIDNCLQRLPAASICWLLKSEYAARTGEVDEWRNDLNKSLYLGSNGLLYGQPTQNRVSRNGTESIQCSIPAPWWQREQFFRGEEMSQMNTPGFACATNLVEGTIRELSSERVR
jgi:O-Antigen ligase